MHRLFVAIELPDKVKEAIRAIQRELPGCRWVSPDQLHLTLRFIGEVGDQTSQTLQKSFSAVHAPPFNLAIAGTGHFPPTKPPRILWTGVNADTNLFVLQRSVEHAVQFAGIPEETRPFAPHITIARLKGTPSAVIREFELHNCSFAPPPFQVTTFHLFRSIFLGNSVSHVKIAEYHLG